MELRENKMGIKKYSGSPGIDGKFPSAQDAKYAGSGQPDLTNCIAWYRNDLLDKNNNVWLNHIRCTNDFDERHVTAPYTQLPEGEYVYCPGIFKSNKDSNNQRFEEWYHEGAELTPTPAWEQIGTIWLSNRTYATGDYVIYKGRVLQSQIDDNLGNVPPLADNQDRTKWDFVTLGRWTAYIAYPANTIVFHPAVWKWDGPGDLSEYRWWFPGEKPFPQMLLSGSTTSDAYSNHYWFPEAWYSSTTTYEEDDWVCELDSSTMELQWYQSLVDNNLGNALTDFTKWQACGYTTLSQKYTKAGLWLNSFDYAPVLAPVGRYVWHNHRVYTSLVWSGPGSGVGAIEPGVTSGWETYWKLEGYPQRFWSLCDIVEWNSNSSYDESVHGITDLVWHNGSVYKSLSNSNQDNNPITSEDPWDPWEELFNQKLPDARDTYRDYRCPLSIEYDHRSVADFSWTQQPTSEAANLQFYGGPATYTLTDYTVIMVFNPSEKGDNYVITRHLAEFSRNSNNLYIKVSNPDWVFTCSTGITLVHNKPLIASLGWSNGNGVYARVNGAEISSQAGDLGSISKTGYAGINNYFGLVGGGHNDLAGAQSFDFLMFNRKLSSTEIEAVENFLLGKWGIEKLKVVTVNNAGNMDGIGKYIKSELSAVYIANNIDVWDDMYENHLYTFSKYLQYNSEDECWELWHDYTEHTPPLPSGNVEGPQMQYVVSRLFTYSSEYGNSHYLLYNVDDEQWEFWMFNEWSGPEWQWGQNLLTYVASGTSDTVPASGWTNVSGISAFDTAPNVSSNF